MSLLIGQAIFAPLSFMSYSDTDKRYIWLLSAGTVGHWGACSGDCKLSSSCKLEQLIDANVMFFWDTQ